MTPRRLIGLSAGAVLALSCGSDPPPVCPDGDCTLPGSTIIKWRFNHYPELGFDSDACSDLGATRVRVEILQVEDPTIFDSDEKGCGEGQLTFVDLPIGTYSVALTPLAADGASLVTEPVRGQVIAGSSGASTELTLDVPHTAWARSYTGQFLFRLSWGGVSCELVAPTPVTQQTLTLTAAGQVVTGVTDSGQKVDGTEPAACRPLTEMFPQFVQGVAFGPATFRVVGRGGPGNTTVLFDHVFDTFVGAGQFNPTLTFDLPVADAGVDAPPDAL